MELFERAALDDAPLAERMRPARLADVVGQDHLLGPGRLLRRSIAQGSITSMILFGPPGSGKTTLARVLARELDARFESFSAVLGGVPELRRLIGDAKERKALRGERTLLFVDEIHRFNKAQQDALLPHVEAGTVTLVGATTENPSFAVNAALLSRAPVHTLRPLSEDDLLELLRRAVSEERGLGRPEWLAHEALLARIAEHADGDARRALTLLESIALGGTFSEEAVADVLAGKRLRHDKSGDSHYDVSSAFIKSLRGSDPDAAIYWMMRLLEGGDDPLFVLRRMLIFASEDVGLADPRALEQAVAADQAFRRLGMPEGLHVMSQCCLYLACAPKSNRAYMAFTAAQRDVERHGTLPVPPHLRNAPTKLAKELGHGEGYRYPHDEGGFARDATYLPERLLSAKYYDPTQNGVESRIRERLASLFPSKRKP